MSAAAARFDPTPTPPFAFAAIKTPPPATVRGIGRRSSDALDLGLASLESMRALRFQMQADSESLGEAGL